MSKITRAYSIILAVPVHDGDVVEAAMEWIRATNADHTWTRRAFFFSGQWCEQLQLDTQAQLDRITLYANLCNIQYHHSHEPEYLQWISLDFKE